MPKLVHSYNQNMGGIDLLDSFLARYRFGMKSSRWYLYLFWHFVMVGVVNAWNVYRRDYHLLSLPPKDMLNRRRFQASAASALVAVNTVPKRGRPSGSGDNSPSQTPRRPKKVRHAPVDDVRKDCYGHWPAKIEKRGRCKLCEKNITNTVCTKCDVRLCFVEERNCFTDFLH